MYLILLIISSTTIYYGAESNSFIKLWCLALNWRGILKILSSLEGVLGALMLLVPLIDFMAGYSITKEFLIGGILFLLLGLLSSKIDAKPLTLLDSLVAVSLAWLLISFESAIALMYSINISFLDAFFESVSGFTGTGFTVLTGLDYMKPSIVTWRSIMQWTGELGFVVFAMVIFPYFYRIGRTAYGLERPVKIEVTFYRTAKALIKIYVVLTVAGIISYIYTGMNLYEAFNHVLTTIATGGMSTYDAGYQVIYDRAPLTYIPVMIFMFIGGMNFYTLAQLFRGEFSVLKKSEEFKGYAISMAILVVAMILSYRYVERTDIWYAITAGSFNLVSGMTTTGFSIGSIAELSDTSKAIIIVGMFLGGMMFSTAGGIKSIRLVIIVKKLKDVSLKSIISAPVERRLTLDQSVIMEPEISQALLFVILHATIIFIGATIMSIYGYNFIDTLFEATSAAGCVGLSAGVLTPTSPDLVKIVIIVLMLLGRLEYIQLTLIIALATGYKYTRTLY